MRVRPLASAVICALLMLLTESSPVASFVPAPNTVPLLVGKRRMPVVPVSIGGHGPYLFLLDTGSNRSCVSASLAARLGLPRLGTTTAMAVTGRTSRDVVAMEEVSVGSRSSSRMPTLVLADEELKSLGVDGLLGQDFLIDHSYTIDFERGRLLWLSPNQGGESPAQGSQIRLRRESGTWLAELTQDDPGAAVVWLVPDSGAQTLVFFEANLPPSLRFQTLGDVTTSTFAGKAGAGAARVQRLKVGSVVHSDEPAVIIRERRPEAGEGHGLLPISQYASVTFYASESYMVVKGR